MPNVILQPDPLNRGFTTQIPTDLSDPPLFGQMAETTKDVILLALRAFFTKAQQTASRQGEAITLDKYSITDPSLSSYENVVSVIRKYPDILEHLPHVCVLTSSGNELAMTIGPPIVDVVQQAPQIVATLPEPYALADGGHLDLFTSPNTLISSPQAIAHTSTLTFTADRFPTGNPIGAALAADVARVINEQALYVTAFVVTTGGLNYVAVRTGTAQSPGAPNAIEVASSTDANTLAVLGVGRRGAGSSASIAGVQSARTFTSSNLASTSADVGSYLVLSGSASTYYNDGRFPITASNSATQVIYNNRFGAAEAFPSGGTWFIGLRDDSLNPVRPPANRFGYQWEMTVEVHVLSNDDNTRDEVSDLVTSALSFYAEQQYFTFHGRSLTDPTIVGENFQLVLARNLRHTGQNEVVRGESGKDKVFVDSFSFGCNLTLYIDRLVLVPSGPSAGLPWIVKSSDLTVDLTLPFSS